jgi:hypothetical protein
LDEANMADVIRDQRAVVGSPNYSSEKARTVACEFLAYRH